MLKPFVVALGLVLGAAAAAQEIDPVPEIEGVISDQIGAFQAGDAQAAFAYASPNIQALFRTPDRFVTMVQRGYPMVWGPAKVRFLEARRAGEAVVQKVLITDPAGALHVLEYQMIEGEGGWLINGVTILQGPQFGA